MPFDYLYERYLPFVIKEGINPEISFSCFTLDTYARDDFRRVADALGGAALAVTLHAPFMDLRPGAIDPMVRRATVDRFRQVFDLAPLFIRSPSSVIRLLTNVITSRPNGSGLKTALRRGENSCRSCRRSARSYLLKMCTRGAPAYSKRFSNPWILPARASVSIPGTSMYFRKVPSIYGQEPSGGGSASCTFTTITAARMNICR